MELRLRDRGYYLCWLFYVITNLVCFHVLGFGGVAASGTVAADSLRAVMGPAGANVIAAISPVTLTPINAILLAAGIAIGLVTIGGYELLIRLYVLTCCPLVVVALFAAARLRFRQCVQ
jgi:hypothetical protein